ncbi:PREDICTED: serine carboxypeptidase-like 40 [Lupinus angustifolius]|uniref:serine carboxypeptidase-like 40 n=1 Tax=Lupinus angustifolius TaxID=3871 RepID=UPI00092F6D41|nr:PREDICTED: serine carboxypeptidase-like 40 [Lupinus angustifolius]
MGKASYWAIQSFLIFSFFVAGIHGNKQTQALQKLYKLKYKANSQIDRSYFKAQELVGDLIIDSNKGLKEKDKIDKLPGQPPVNFSQYGGYVTVDKSVGRAFYYYFVESQHSKKTKPLLLWLNGGPGCSSLGYGAMEEIGPFRVNSDRKTLNQNIYSWNNAANILFLESPAGTGFSYSNKSSEYETSGDRKTAIDNYVFLVNWLERFPEYKKRDFYIVGESYAGHFVPQLAQTILQQNKKANHTIINLKGIMIGNPVIHDERDNKGTYDFLASHAIISDQTAYDFNKFCNNSSDPKNIPIQCDKAQDEFSKDTDDIDLSNIYAPNCKNDDDPNLTATTKMNSIVNDPCSDDYVHTYLNRGDVQEALHANVTKLKYTWELCSSILLWVDSSPTIIPLLHEFLNNRLRVWIFSGDVDGIVPITSTKYSIKEMNLSTKTAWHPWFIDREVGGYTQVYKGDLTFATVRGAGHQVPISQPRRAFSLIQHFLNGTQLQTTK